MVKFRGEKDLWWIFIFDMNMLKSSVLLLVYCTLIWRPLSGQNKVIDSLTLELNKRVGVEKLDVSFELLFEYVNLGDFRHALSYAERFQSMALQVNDTLKFIKGGRLRAQLLRRLERNDESFKAYYEIFAILKDSYVKNQSYYGEAVYVLNGLALLHSGQAEYDKALDYHFKAIELIKAVDLESMSTALHNVGFVYYKLENFDKAIDYYERSLQIKNEIKYYYDFEQLLVNISLCYAYKRNYIKSQEYLNRSLLFCKGKCTSNLYIDVHFAQGVIDFGLRNFQKAESSFLKSYLLSLKNANMRFQLENIVYLSQIYIKFKKFDLAKYYLNEAEKISSGLSYNLLFIEINQQFSNLYYETKDYQNAARYQSKYILLRDSIYGEQLTQNLMAVQVEYEQRENKAKLESQNKLLDLREHVIQRQQWLNILAGFTVLLLIALVAALYRNNKQKRKTNQLLDLKVQERTKALANSFQIIEKAYVAQSHLLVKASSNIRSPLSTMKGLCSLAMQEIDEPLTKAYLLKIDSTTKKIWDIVNKLLPKS
jgi:tetratricopeptide (TPR) repeat protein